jgi:predicted acetylornithine/succinylornithine family transaminase
MFRIIKGNVRSGRNSVRTNNSTLEEIIALAEDGLIKTYNRLPVAFVKGEGTRLWDTEGREYLDFIGGLGACGLGHCHPKVVEAIQRQAATIIHTSNLFHISPQAKLAKLLSSLSGGRKCFFCNSGAEANEGAIKLARKHAHVVRGIEQPEIIVAEGSFHGRTLGALSATAQPKYQKDFVPLVPGFVVVPFNGLKALKKAVNENTCAIMLEPIQGEIGVLKGTVEFLHGAERICRDIGALLIMDEIQTGLGRTGKWFAYQHFGVEPDVVTLAKSIAGGVPMGALLAKPQVADVFRPGDHASTFGGNFLACAAALAALEALQTEKLVENAAEMGDFFKDKLLGLKGRYPQINEIRGLGLMLALVFELPIARQILMDCLGRGLVINAIGEHIIRFLPPLVTKKEEIEEACVILGEVLAKVLGG